MSYASVAAKAAKKKEPNKGRVLAKSIAGLVRKAKGKKGKK